MKIFVYLDESGSIHKNSSTKYFAVGGYFALERDRLKIISSYREITDEYKSRRNIKFSKEIKGRDMNNALKENILTELQSIESFYGIAKVFDKTRRRQRGGGQRRGHRLAGRRLPRGDRPDHQQHPGQRLRHHLRRGQALLRGQDRLLGGGCADRL